MNHQSAVSEAYDVSISNMKSALQGLKNEYEELKINLSTMKDDAKKERDEKIEVAKTFSNKERSKSSINRANENYNSFIQKLTIKELKMKEKIDLLNEKIKMKEKTRGVALGTSKMNYSDPRLTISWCKDHNVNLDRIYNKTMQKKFEWALNADEEFYKKYPNVEE